MGRNQTGKERDMGFFRNISMDVHAQSVAANLVKIRDEQFSCILHNVEHVVGEAVIPNRRILGGTADLSLKGFQFWILLRSMAAHGYVPKKDYDTFNGMVMHHSWSQERDAVSDYMLRFDKYNNDSAAQIVQVAIPIADCLFEDRKDPRFWAVIGQTLAVFYLQTEFAIASEFNDKPTMQGLQAQIESLCSFQTR